LWEGVQAARPRVTRRAWKSSAHMLPRPSTKIVAQLSRMALGKGA
jgi:hypothetical protein